MNALATLGIKLEKEIPLEILLGEYFNGKMYGMTKAQIEKVKALREIILTYNSSKETDTASKITDSLTAARLMYHKMKALSHEEMHIVFVNGNSRVINTEMLFKGCIDSVIINIRDIISKCLCSGARGFFLYHNHPSGNPSPSIQDISITKKLKTASELMGINFIDHIIISRNCYYSFTDERMTTVDDDCMIDNSY